MGGQQSQPQTGVKILGVTGGGGNFGKIAEGLAAGKVTFDTNTGALTQEIQTGTTQSSMRLVPDDNIDLGQYIAQVSKLMKAGAAQNPGVYPSTSTMMAFDTIGTQVGAEAIGQPIAGGGNPVGAKIIPMVTAWQIKNPPVRAVVYTDKAGVSKFLYKNDPGNVVQLVQNGSRVAAGASNRVAAVRAVAASVDMNKYPDCVKQVIMPMLTEDQKKQAETGFQSCMGGPRPQRVSDSAAPAPAVQMGESGYLAEGVVPVTFTGGYPTWVLVMALVALVLAFLIARNA